VPITQRHWPIARFFGYYPGTVAVITAEHGGVRNVMSAGWHAALSIDPPMYGVAVGRTRATHPLITASGQFAVHFLPFSEASVIAAVGSVSLSALSGEDKFARFNLAVLEQPSSPPILKAAYLAYVCRVTGVTPTGDHDWIAGEVEAVYFDEAAYDTQSLFAVDQAQATIYLGRSTYVALDGKAPQQTFTPGQFK
jgi:flavin reductase (DIM6/NTAB) family NADH-FMN oxidoreductase RutF